MVPLVDESNPDLAESRHATPFMEVTASQALSGEIRSFVMSRPHNDGSTPGKFFVMNGRTNLQSCTREALK